MFARFSESSIAGWWILVALLALARLAGAQSPANQSSVSRVESECTVREDGDSHTRIVV
jgi:hypothetical protein